MCLDDSCPRVTRRETLAVVAGAAVLAATAARSMPAPRGQDFRFEHGGEPIFGYRVATAARRPRGTAVVLHGNAGLPDEVKDTADWLADLGFMALAVSSTSREPDPSKIPRSMLMSRAYGDRYIADTRAGLAALGSGAPAGPLAIIGYCGGGYTGLLWGAEELGREIGALVAIHTPLHNREPDGAFSTGRPQGIDLYRAMPAPVQWHFGGDDNYTPAGDIEELRAFERKRRRKAQIHIYSGARHGFAMAGHDTYMPAAARLVRARASKFLAAHFPAPA